MRIKDQLIFLAEQWASVNGKSIATLAKTVVSDNKFFVRISLPGKDLNIGTFEKFLIFFRDGANWPDGRIPEAACELLENFSNIALPAPASPDKNAESIGDAGTDATADDLPDGGSPPSMTPGQCEAGAAEGSLSAPVERAA